MSTQLSLQSVRNTHSTPHSPLLQVAVAPATVAGGQGLHLVPQLATLLSLAHKPEQSCVPLGHAHPPATHALVSPQRMPHAPQLAASVLRSTQAPLHSMKPELHSKPQLPRSHTGSACATLVVHLLPHVPQ